MSPKWERTGEWELYDCPEFYFDIDEYRCGEDQMIFCHIKYRKWSKSALEKSSKVFWTFRAAVDCPLYVIGDGDKFERFVRRFNFIPFAEIDCDDNQRRRIFVSIKDFTGVQQVQQDSRHEH